ncbi:MAG: DnaA regulatory inactivator Hda [Pseudomonadota bacterium]
MSDAAAHRLRQLSLNVSLRDGATFDNYVPGPNREALHVLQHLVEGPERVIYLWGAPGAGKTHLLHAVCHAAAARGARSAYLPLADARHVAPELLEGLEQLDAVCIDDVQTVAGLAPWETALFHLYNRMRDSGAHLVMAGNAPPAELGLNLPDLSSRLLWGLSLQLRLLGDEEKLAALRRRAQGRGFDVPEEVARFLLRRAPRDMATLFALLERLDQASLAQQRKLTVPFVSELLRRVE